MSDVVLPGEEVGVVEQYVPEGHIYEQNGILRSLVFGKLKKDDSTHIVSVIKLSHKPRIPVKGDLVYCVVTDVRSKMVTVDIVSKNKETFPSPFVGLIPVSMVHTERIDSAENYFAPSDIVLAKVVSERPPFVLTTNNQELGVILARCRECGVLLESNSKSLICSSCGARNLRKLSSNYVLTTTAQQTYNNGYPSNERSVNRFGNNRKRHR
jgi:exosome complex component CSL4